MLKKILSSHCQFVALSVNSALVSSSHATFVMKKTKPAAVSPSSKPGTQTSMHCTLPSGITTNNNWASSVTSPLKVDELTQPR